MHLRFDNVISRNVYQNAPPRKWISVPCAFSITSTMVIVVVVILFPIDIQCTYLNWTWYIWYCPLVVVREVLSSSSWQPFFFIYHYLCFWYSKVTSIYQLQQWLFYSSCQSDILHECRWAEMNRKTNYTFYFASKIFVQINVVPY